MNLSTLTDSQLLDATRAQLRRANEADADLLLLLGEVEHRRLYAERACSSMFAFCVRELGFSEDAIFTTLENRMKCGLGKCGRCNIGPVYVCKDGPVFTKAQLDKLPREY